MPPTNLLPHCHSLHCAPKVQQQTRQCSLALS